MFAMLFSGRFSDFIGRKSLLIVVALLYAISSLLSAYSTTYEMLYIARMIGGLAFGAALGVIPLDMPESVLVKFSGKMQPGITLRDLVNAIPYAAIQKGLLTVEKEGKKNVFSGRCLEIEGLSDLKIEQAFELSDASAERSASGCTVLLDEAPIIEYLN